MRRAVGEHTDTHARDSVTPSDNTFTRQAAAKVIIIIIIIVIVIITTTRQL